MNLAGAFVGARRFEVVGVAQPGVVPGRAVAAKNGVGFAEIFARSYEADSAGKDGFGGQLGVIQLDAALEGSAHRDLLGDWCG